MVKRLLSGAIFLVAVLLSCTAPVLAATSVRIDRSFGVDGIGGGELGLHYSPTSFENVVEQADGSLLATREAMQRRYLPNGDLDRGFAPQSVEPPPPEATQPDGKRLVRGENRGTVVRLNPDGTQDPGFHGGVSEPAGAYWLEIIEPLPSGKILVAGVADRPVGKSGVESRTGISRFNPDGTLDRSFGEAGSVFVSDDRTWGLVALAPQPDEGVLLVGRRATLRLAPGGGLDKGFAATTYPPEAEAIGGEALPGGGFALGGETGAAGHRAFFVARYGPGGGLDPSFAGGRGIAVADLGGDAKASSYLWEEGGAMVIGGSTAARDPRCEEVEACIEVPVVVRFGADGSLDPGYGSGGVARLEPLAGAASRTESLAVWKLAPRRAGGYFAAGSAPPDSTTAFLAALTTAGRLDPGFGSGGIVRETKPSRSYEYDSAVAIGRDGKIVVAGNTTAGYGEGAAVFRYTRNGEVDSGYGEGGFARLPGLDRPLDVAVERSGAAVVLGEDGELTRVTPGGTIDPGFGAGLPVALDRPEDAFGSLAVLADGKVLIAGTSDWHGRRSRMLVARLRADGSLDRSFGRKGFATVGCARRGRCGANQLSVEPDGSILLAGRVQKTGAKAQYYPKPSRLAVARLHSDGRPDRGFGGAGMVTLRAGYHAVATAIAGSGGEILVAGRVGSRRGVRQALLLRFRPDGRLDRRFGSEGIVRRSDADEPVALLPTPGRIFVVYEEGPVVVHAFDPSGRLESLREGRLTRSSKWEMQFEAALQGRKPVLVWSMIKGPSPSSRTQIELARLGG